MQMLDNAKSNVLVQAYSFTSEPIAKALVRVHGLGVEVQVILDRSQRTSKYIVADFLIRAGIPVLIDASPAIAHNKVMIIDSNVVVTGSFNYMKAAKERNAENLLIIRSRELPTGYAQNCWIHKRHSTPPR